MKAKKYLIAATVTMFLFAALLLTAGIYFLLTADPFAFMNDGTLDDTGIAGIVIILFLGIPALLAKLLIYMWIVLGALFILFGIALAVITITQKRYDGLNVLLYIFSVFEFMIAYLAFHILLISVLILISADNPKFPFILAEFMNATFAISILSAILNILAAGEIKACKTN